MKKINICFHIGDITLAGGTERITITLANNLMKYFSDKYNILIISNTRKNNTPFFKIDKRIGCKYLYKKNYHFKLYYPLTMLKELFLLKKFRCDILVSVDSILSLIDIPASKILMKKNICWEHFNVNTDFGYNIRNKARKLATNKSDYIVVLSEKDKESYIKKYGKELNINRIYNCSTIEVDDNIVYHFGNNIVSCGRLSKEKGFDMLIEVANKLRNKQIKYNWNILGDGPERDNIQSLINKYKLNDCVHLLGNVNDVGKYFKNSNLFVLTSRFEGFGLVLIEAQQYKLPVISFDCDFGPSEIIDDNVNGFLIKSFDIEEMTNKIELLLKNKELSKSFSNHSQINIKKFAPEQIAKEWDDLFDMIK